MIETKEDEKLKKLKIVSSRLLQCGTGFSVGQVLKEVPTADPHKVFEMLSEKFHQRVFPESKAIKEVVRELRKIK